MLSSDELDTLAHSHFLKQCSEICMCLFENSDHTCLQGKTVEVVMFSCKACTKSAT